jgi:hypothetical protein
MPNIEIRSRLEQSEIVRAIASSNQKKTELEAQRTGRTVRALWVR